jgi:hypothetical protein
MQRLFVALHVTLGSYLRDALHKGIEIEIEIFYSNTSKTGWSLWGPPCAMLNLLLDF